MDGEDRFTAINNPATWEEKCEDAAEYELNKLEERLAEDKEQNSQRLWISFQNAANAVAQLFRERGENFHGATFWAPFQETANLVTILYKDSLDIHKRNFDAGYQLGYKKRNREVLAWAKKKKRSIRRDELLSYLSGRSPPRYQRGDMVEDVVSEEVQCSDGYSSIHNNQLLQNTVPISSVVLPNWNKRRTQRNESFVTENDSRENFRDTRKRSLSSQDVVMDTTGHKKGRFL